jgi:hypothetical protein
LIEMKQLCGVANDLLAHRAIRGGKSRTAARESAGYIDRKLRVVIPPRYDWGFPFERGKAVVCSGYAQKRDGGEHRFVEGGMWGAVDRNGREIVPLQYRSREDLPK